MDGLRPNLLPALPGMTSNNGTNAYYVLPGLLVEIQLHFYLHQIQPQNQPYPYIHDMIR